MKLELIKKIRVDKNISLRELADKSKISYSYISLLEIGKKNNPSLKVIEQIAAAHGQPMHRFL